MSKTRSFRLAMAALAVALIAAIALISPPAPALAGCTVPNTCAGVNTYCLNNCPGGCCDGGSLAACINFHNQKLACLFGDCTEDGRVNRNCSAPEIVYCDEDEIDFYYYNYFELDGEFDFSVPTDLLLVSVEVRTLVWQDGAVQVYLNPDGSVLLLAPQTDGKTYYLQFDPYVCVPIHEGAEWGLQ